MFRVKSDQGSKMKFETTMTGLTGRNVVDVLLHREEIEYESKTCLIGETGPINWFLSPQWRRSF